MAAAGPQASTGSRKHIDGCSMQTKPEQEHGARLGFATRHSCGRGGSILRQTRQGLVFPAQTGSPPLVMLQSWTLG